jgi:hypothetical protein
LLADAQAAILGLTEQLGTLAIMGDEAGGVTLMGIPGLTPTDAPAREHRSRHQ